MSLESVYREAMAVNTITDMGKREAAAKAFFAKLNKMELPAKFNWAAEIFEGLHVKERGDQLALIWTDWTRMPSGSSPIRNCPRMGINS